MFMDDFKLWQATTIRLDQGNINDLIRHYIFLDKGWGRIPLNIIQLL